MATINGRQLKTVTHPSAASTLQKPLCRIRDNYLKTKLLRSLRDSSNLLFAILRLIVLRPFVHVLLAVFDEPIEQTGQLASHGGNGFGRAQTRAQSAVLRPQIALAAQQCGGGMAQSCGRVVDDLARAPIQNPAAALL